MFLGFETLCVNRKGIWLEKVAERSNHCRILKLCSVDGLQSIRHSVDPPRVDPPHVCPKRGRSAPSW